MTHIGRDEKVVVGELKVIAASENRWLTGEDVVGGHLKSWLGGWLRRESDICLDDFI